MATRHRSPSTLFARNSRWKRIKRLMFSLITKCEKCGELHNLTVHHVKPRQTHPELAFEPSNLVVLCQECHNIVHNGRP